MLIDDSGGITNLSNAVDSLCPYKAQVYAYEADVRVLDPIVIKEFGTTGIDRSLAAALDSYVGQNIEDVLRADLAAELKDIDALVDAELQKLDAQSPAAATGQSTAISEAASTATTAESEAAAADSVGAGGVVEEIFESAKWWVD